ncbi:MAG: hypothetical protein IT340_07225 [Chloroflexi bacterium]|nr:hypothetical protein [Chloroflexota bacterium]
MAVTRLDIRARGLYEGGQSFGDTSAYERLDGIIRFAADPTYPANAAIVDLDRAARNPAGQVEFEADVCLLQPADATRANRRLLFYVVNRGRMGGVPMSGAVVPQTLTDRIDPGNGFLLRHGWTVLMVGWQWDVVRRTGYLGLEAPQALADDGRPIQGRIVVQFQPNEPHQTQMLAHWPLHPPPGDPDFIHRPYPAADVDDPDAVLTVRDTPDGPRTTIPRGDWRFARDDGGRAVPDDTFVWLDGGFEPGRLYEVIYRTRICPVVGTGLLAMRDAVSFWRYADAAAGNPSAGRIDYTFGFGISQCGRFLREYIYQGLNLDEAGRVVFDGLIPQVAGARRGEFNQRFGQPSVQHVAGPGHLPPFADDEQTDPVGGWSDGLLRRQRALGGVPRIFTTNTSSEYWRIDASLLHTDPLGQRDLPEPPEARWYLFAGTKHGPGTLPLTKETPSGARLANDDNIVNYHSLVRAALVNLDRWVTAGVEPPLSAVPRLADGTAISRERALDQLGEIPAAVLPDTAVLPTLHRLDLGPDADRAGGPFPPAMGAPYRSYVPALDADGNEVAGIRLPDLTVPLGTHTGWSPRDPATGGAGQIVDMQGSTLPFPRTSAERARAGDPRRAITDRYRDRDDYLTRVRAAALALVEQRFLLAEDVDGVVADAAARWAALAPGVG